MKLKTIETIVWTFGIIIFVMLTIKISINSKDYSCDNCVVILTNTLADGQSYEFGTFNIEELFKEYENGHCKIVWSTTGGYTNG
jgi:hypothetical protein